MMNVSLKEKVFFLSELLSLWILRAIHAELEDFLLLVIFLLVAVLWLSVALICLDKTVFGPFSCFFVALILGKCYAYSP